MWTLTELNINITLFQDVQEGLHGCHARPTCIGRKLPQGKLPPVTTLCVSCLWAIYQHHRRSDIHLRCASISHYLFFLLRMLTAGVLTCLLWTQPALITHYSLCFSNWSPDTVSTADLRSLSQWASHTLSALHMLRQCDPIIISVTIWL